MQKGFRFRVKAPQRMAAVISFVEGAHFLSLLHDISHIVNLIGGANVVLVLDLVGVVRTRLRYQVREEEDAVVALLGSGK